ncbi:hypothetical protein UY3_01996 [Chelonia mydas]|uniref:Uncharacterized protein n=1 Tax=Chelonia mydas TaxID=8469 RepID=M7BYF2_CHEMY|nr:hypothetical protein UY3_01996 [Chelonia mydas]
MSLLRGAMWSQELNRKAEINAIAFQIVVGKGPGASDRFVYLLRPQVRPFTAPTGCGSLLQANGGCGKGGHTIFGKNYQIAIDFYLFNGSYPAASNVRSEVYEVAHRFNLFRRRVEGILQGGKKQQIRKKMSGRGTNRSIVGQSRFYRDIWSPYPNILDSLFLTIPLYYLFNTENFILREALIL